jgi:hypothetical protein
LRFPQITRYDQNGLSGLRTASIIGIIGMLQTWTIQRYGESHGWQIAYRGTERRARCTYQALGEVLSQGYLRLINPKGAIVEALRRPTPAEAILEK